MNELLTFARGPLFGLTFGIMIIGLLRLVVLQLIPLFRLRGERLNRVKWNSVLKESLSWTVPVAHLNASNAVFVIVSFVLHVGLVLVPVFLVDHIALWERLLGLNLPAIGRGLADVLTLCTLGGLLVLLAFRIFDPQRRAASDAIDYWLLVLLMIPFGTGYLALHPEFNPFPWTSVMLVHLLSAELLFVMTPFTKLAHVVLYVFDRISSVHWELRPGSGDRVAHALFGENARV